MYGFRRERRPKDLLAVRKDPATALQAIVAGRRRDNDKTLEHQRHRPVTRRPALTGEFSFAKSCSFRGQKEMKKQRHIAGFREDNKNMSTVRIEALNRDAAAIPMQPASY